MTSKFEQMHIKKTPEEKGEINKTRKKYEEFASKKAKDINNWVENLLGKGLSKKDIMHSDAESEDWMRKHGTGIGTGVNSYQAGKNLENAPMLTLTFHEMERLKADIGKIFSERELREFTGYKELKGEIDGKKIKIKCYLRFNEVKNFSGTVDNVELNYQQCKDIYKNYSPIARVEQRDNKETYENWQNEKAIKKGNISELPDVGVEEPDRPSRHNPLMRPVKRNFGRGKRG